MRLKRSALERGDTIIEVIFAFVIFSFVAISSLTIMNKGVAAGEKALEITLVRQQISAQAEALRYIHEARIVSPSSPYAATWDQLKNKNNYGQDAASSFGVSGVECLLPAGTSFKPFVLNARTAQILPASPSMAPTANSGFPPYSQVIYNSDSSVREAYGIWIESVPSSIVSEKPFVDFHIRACWPAPGSPRPITLGTIVRLYDPA